MDESTYPGRPAGALTETVFLSDREQHEWWQTAVVYQVYVRSFKDTSGNGVGDLQGIIDKMDYVSDTLGVDAIWITPFYPSPMADFGYQGDHRPRTEPLVRSTSVVHRVSELTRTPSP